MRTHARRNRGFTLVEILIVVIILGILAAIVIPQFTSASTDARNNSLKSLLQTMRSQIELYKLQHNDDYPGLQSDDSLDAADFWADLTGKTNPDGTAGGALGPYLQSTPVNSLNSNTTIVFVADEADAAAAVADGVGFVFVTDTGKVFASNKDEDGLFVE